MPATNSSPGSRSVPAATAFFGRRAPLAIAFGLLACLAAGWVSLTAGPGLSDHEVIVAQTARQMLQDGQWLVPHYLDTPFLVKPPLMYWLVALPARLFNLHDAAGLPVSELSARLPSALATVLTLLVIFRLARSMFDTRRAWIATFVYATTIGAMLYAFNATVEAVLTLFCTWAFAEFWWSQQAATPGARRWHLLGFYLALGLGMLSKGPMPMIMVALPIAAWWWCGLPAQMLADLGGKATGLVVVLGVRQIGPRLRAALTQLGLWWGIPLFLAIFVPWMVYVGRSVDYAWKLWNVEYVSRMEGDYPGAGGYDIWYYLPIIFGLMVPWSLSLPEALAAPFLRAYQSARRPMTYLWFWVTVGTIFMSIMTFKKPYYIVPALPGLALLLTPVLDRFFFSPEPTHRRRATWAILSLMVILTGMWVGLWFFGHAKYPEVWDDGLMTWGAPLGAGLCMIGVLLAGLWYRSDRRLPSFLAVGGTSLTVFTVCWIVLGPRLANLENPLALVEKLEQAGISPETPVHWIGVRPDGRVAFYRDRLNWVRQVMDPYKSGAEQSPNSDKDDQLLSAGMEVSRMLEDQQPAYIVMKRGRYGSFRAFFQPKRGHELLYVDRGKLGRDEDDWVVVTNQGEPTMPSPPTGQPF